MDKDRLFDLTAVLLIAVVGLIIAYVTFGVLESSAEGRLSRYSVGGAITGALVSMTLVASLYLQIRESGQPVRMLAQEFHEREQELQRRNRELENKVLRSAPKPDGFESEIDERYRIVLTRPKNWVPKDAVIFSYEGPATEDDSRREDTFRPYVEVRALPLPEDWRGADEYYKTHLEEWCGDRNWVESFTIRR